MISLPVSREVCVLVGLDVPTRRAVIPRELTCTLNYTRAALLPNSEGSHWLDMYVSIYKARKGS